MQLQIDFQKERKEIKRRMKGAELAVYETLKTKPWLRSVKRRNDLIREVWDFFGDYPAESITRFARKFQADDIFDIKYNQKVRANIETTYNNYFKC